MADFGGPMRLTIAGRLFKLRAAFKYDPTRYKPEVIVNQDGSISRSMKPGGYGFEVTLEDDPAIDWDAVIRGGPYNVTGVEEHTGVLHMWTGTVFSGEPKVDAANGEVSGINGTAPVYQRNKG